MNTHDAWDDCWGQTTPDGFCGVGAPGEVPDFMVWGDSHADAAMPAFKDLAGTYKVTGWFASYGGCPPLLTVYRIDRPARHKCKQFNDTVAKLIIESGIKTVFLISRWTVYSDGHNEDGPQSGKRTLIASADHAPIFIGDPSFE